MQNYNRRNIQLLDAHGRPLTPSGGSSLGRIGFGQIPLRAKWDAAQTVISNENHWNNADNLDPIAATSYVVRRTLRSRSRYEIIENNPFLKGIILMVCNDFVGSGPRLQVTDQRISPERRKIIEQRFHSWAKEIKYRQKLWRMRMAKIVDGEAFALPYFSPKNRDAVKLNYQIVETDRVTAPLDAAGSHDIYNQFDGVRFDNYYEATHYYVHNAYPSTTSYLTRRDEGKWVRSENIIHWFRQDRGWLRGIPELTASLPQCAVLRRYTLAMLRHAETAADFAAFLETEAPANPYPMENTANGSVADNADNWWETFPIDMGMMTTLPSGYKLKQLEAVPFGVQYDEYVGSVLREILRPLNVPFNYVIASSKDSNMASAVVDSSIYRKGQESERTHSEEEVLCEMFDMYWREAVLIDGYFGDVDFSMEGDLRTYAPQHKWRWDEVVPMHTDPTKVATFLQTMFNAGFLTDKDIQEKYIGRPYEEWVEEIIEQMMNREEIGPISPQEKMAEAQIDLADSNDAAAGTSSSPKKAGKKRPAKKASADSSNDN